ncbi:MAG: reverse transcriptase domain-containing protein [Candidatus Paceibacterota bacterium]
MKSPDFWKAITALRQANEGQSPLNRISAFKEAWKSAPNSLRRTLFRGLYTRINPSKLPPPNTHPSKTHYCRSRKDLSWAASEIKRYISEDLLFPNSDPRCLIHPWFVVYKRGKPRLVIDFLLLNNAILESPSVHYEDLRRVPSLVRRRVWMVSVDIKSAFHHVPLSPLFQTLCSIEFEGQVYSFRVLTFGINIAPRFWCLLLGHILEKLRSPPHSLKLIFYMDDILLVSRRRHTCYSHLHLLLSTLHSHGLVISWEKSVLTPTRSIRHLGFIINSETLSFTIPPDKLADIRSFLSTAASKPSLRFRSAQSLLGKLLSIHLAFAPAKRFSWRLCSEIYAQLPPLHALRRVRNTFRLILSPSAREDLRWIHSNIARSPSRSFSITTPTHYVYTDASLTGWGCFSPSTHQLAYGHWSRAVRQNPPHIQLLEMEAVAHAISSLSLPPHSRIHLYTDNQAVLAYLKKWGGTRSPALRDLTFKVWDIAIARRFTIDQVSYIPSASNSVADQLSRIPPPNW